MVAYVRHGIKGQRADPNLKPRFDKLPSGYRLAADGLLERKSDATGPEKEIWVLWSLQGTPTADAPGEELVLTKFIVDG